MSSPANKNTGVSGDALSKLVIGNDERRAQAAQHAAKLLENSEELFRASLSAKNEEISKMTEILRSVRSELAREVHLVHKLNAQLACAQEDLESKSLALEHANLQITDLEKENADMKKRVDLIVEGNKIKPIDQEEIEKLRRECDVTVDALRQRALVAERDAEVQRGLVAAMKQMIAHQWEIQNGDPSLLQAKIQMLEHTHSACEAETIAAKSRSLSLERQLQGKDETIQALRAQLNATNTDR